MLDSLFGFTGPSLQYARNQETPTTLDWSLKDRELSNTFGCKAQTHYMQEYTDSSHWPTGPLLIYSSTTSCRRHWTDRTGFGRATTRNVSITWTSYTRNRWQPGFWLAFDFWLSILVTETPAHTQEACGPWTVHFRI